MNSNLELRVRNEIEELHEFFVGWFSGEAPVDSFEAEFLSRFDQKFILIPPAGNFLSLAELQSSIYQNHATNPDFRISIRNVKIQGIWDGIVLATYEEWQRNALASKPPDNARISSVVFKQSESLQWLHVHETWMPESIASAGPYDF